jgi:hypothetical protein
MELKEKSFVAAMMDFFGRKPGQTMGDFSAELRALTPQDREYFTAGLEQNGYKIVS